VHHHTFKRINQADAAVSQVYYLSFKYSSTCFGHPHGHHQEPPPPRSNGKPEAATAVVELLMMGMRMPETC
jgi:hypothetical protein